MLEIYQTVIANFWISKSEVAISFTHFPMLKLLLQVDRMHFPIVCIRHKKNNPWLLEKEWRLQTNKKWYSCLSNIMQSIEWASCSEQLFCYYDVYSNSFISIQYLIFSDDVYLSTLQYNRYSNGNKCLTLTYHFYLVLVFILLLFY